VALDTQFFIAVKSRNEFVLTPFGGMTTRTGHHLPGPRIKNLCPDRMGEITMQPMAFIADIIDRSLEHVREVGPVLGMTIYAGIRHFMLVFSSIVSLECV